jgi:hypothetical protein
MTVSFADVLKAMGAGAMILMEVSVVKSFCRLAVLLELQAVSVNRNSIAAQNRFRMRFLQRGKRCR